MTENIESKFGSVKLVNGDELVGFIEQIKTENGINIQLSNPLKLVTKINFLTGQEGNIFEKYNILSDDPFINISSDKILHITELSGLGLAYYLTSLQYIERFVVPINNKTISDIVNQMKNTIIEEYTKTDLDPNINPGNQTIN